MIADLVGNERLNLGCTFGGGATTGIGGSAGTGCAANSSNTCWTGCSFS
jgi:hypothetical protein